MDTPDPADAAAIFVARQTLLRLQEQADLIRAELTRLRRDLATAEALMASAQGGHLLAVNEQLVLTALREQARAAAALIDLGEMSHASQFDPLTDMPNRSLMRDRLRGAIAAGQRHGGRLAVLFLDLDGFKQINDHLGHAAGDLVLQQVARRLESVLRASDSVSRHGGDEFVVLLNEVATPADVRQIAEKILAALAQPGMVADPTLRLSGSVGVALCPDDAADADALICLADAAMYQAKRQGPGRIAFHTG